VPSLQSPSPRWPHQVFQTSPRHKNLSTNVPQNTSYPAPRPQIVLQTSRRIPINGSSQWSIRAHYSRYRENMVLNPNAGSYEIRRQQDCRSSLERTPCLSSQGVPTPPPPVQHGSSTGIKRFNPRIVGWTLGGVAFPFAFPMYFHYSTGAPRGSFQLTGAIPLPPPPLYCFHCFEAKGGGVHLSHFRPSQETEPEEGVEDSCLLPRLRNRFPTVGQSIRTRKINYEPHRNGVLVYLQNNMNGSRSVPIGPHRFAAAEGSSGSLQPFSENQIQRRGGGGVSLPSVCLQQTIVYV